MYSTCKQQQTAKYMDYSAQRSRKRPKIEEKIVHTAKVLLQKKVLLNREDLFKPPKKHFNLG